MKLLTALLASVLLVIAAHPAAAGPDSPESRIGKGERGEAPARDGIREKLIRVAEKMLDIPYRFGGSSFLGIDCSGYVQKVFGMLDMALPRTAREQFHLGKLVGLEDLSVGDLVFFRARNRARSPSHVGIYLGDNRFIHASSKERRVTIDSLDAPYYLKHFVGARRLLEGGPDEGP